MRKQRALLRLVFPLVLAMYTPGCAVGLDSVLFVTKTEVAVDVDSEPPSLDIGYARREFVLAPSFKDGQIHPVLTTIGVRPSALDFGSNQSFTTGDAALVMADAMTSEDPYPFDGSDKVHRPQMNSTITTSTTDRAPKDGFWASLWYFLFGSSERRRYFFGTDTSFGMHVQWSAGELPRSVAVGYKRKELAFVPLIERGNYEADGKTLKDKTLTLASLIATANVKSEVKNLEESSVEIGQTFATGAAATLLAADPGVRQVLGPSIIPDYEKIKAFNLSHGYKAANRAFLSDVYAALERLKEKKDPKATRLKDALDGLDSSKYRIKFTIFKYDAVTNIVYEVPPPDVSTTEPFKNVVTYLSFLDGTVAALKDALAKGGSTLRRGLFDSTTGTVVNLRAVNTNEEKKKLTDAQEMISALLSATEAKLAIDKTILEAVAYYISQLTR